MYMAVPGPVTPCITICLLAIKKHVQFGGTTFLFCSSASVLELRNVPIGCWPTLLVNIKSMAPGINGNH